MTAMNAQAAVLRADSGETVPLLGVSASGRLDGLLFELSVEQRYQNAGEANIEAVYTFPLPQRAVLLGLELEIGGRSLKGVALARKAASERYEEAIDAGNTAALLDQAGDGLYTVNLGNLKAGEAAVIRYRYAELLDRHGTGDDGYVRLAVPTVIAPRYGSASDAGIAPHAEPGTSLVVEYPFALSIDVKGLPATAALASPSHAIDVAPIDGGRRVTLRGEPLLDRDFILQVTGAGTAAAALTAPDGDAFATLVSVAPGLPASEPRPLALKLLVDCSGSMAGDSIAVARRAMTAILDRLHAGDAVSITRFGSDVQDVTRGLVPVTAAGLDLLRAGIRGIEADLGGTEIVGAVRHVLKLPSEPARARDILLITDGEVWALDRLLQTVADAGHRLFVVAVGAAPNEALARRLAEAAGGACEFVSPNEDAEAAIVRMYQRMREPARRITRITWPATPAWEGPLPAAVFPGDTLHLFAGFGAAPAGEVLVEIAADGEAPRTLRVALREPAGLELLPRVAAARRLATLPEDEAARLAEHHQLATRWTSFVVVQVRAEGEQAEGLPELRAVPQMLAAGWGGVASVARMVPGAAYEATRFLHLEACLSAPEPAAESFRGRRMSSEDWDESGPDASLDLPDFLAELAPPVADPDRAALLDQLQRQPAVGPAEFLRRVLAYRASRPALPDSLGDLALLGLPAAFAEGLLTLADAGRHRPERIVAVLVALLANSPAGSGLTAEERELLTGTVLQDREQRGLRRILQARLGGVTAEHWDTRRAVTG